LGSGLAIKVRPPGAAREKKEYRVVGPAASLSHDHAEKVSKRAKGCDQLSCPSLHAVTAPARVCRRLATKSHGGGRKTVRTTAHKKKRG